MLRSLAGVKRIASVTEDLLYLLGRSLQRRAMRNGVLVALAYGSTLLGVKVAGADKLSKEQVLGLLVAMFASYPAGTLLVRVSNLLTRGHLITAAGGHLHLTSHYKKAHMRDHLLFLWNTVYRYEAALRKNIDDIINSRARLKAVEEMIHQWIEGIPPPVRDAMQLCNEADEQALMERVLSGYAHDPDVEATRELFILTGLYALRTPMPQPIQERQVGFDISPLEDWYEKGLFTPEDYPAKAFARDPLIKDVLDRIASPWRNRVGEWLSQEPAASFWFSLTIRKLGVLVGKGIRDMNRELHEPEASGYFNTQHFLWPSAELDEDVRNRYGDRGDALLGHLTALRVGIMRNLFSSDPETARHHILRMFLSDYRRIFKARMRYDVEYAGGLLAVGPEDDIQHLSDSYGTPGISPRVVSRLAKTARDNLETFERRIADRLGRHGDSEEVMRALKIAFHVDYGDLRSTLERDPSSPANRDLARIVDTVADLKDRFHAELIRIRVFHALVMLQVRTYTDVVESLSFPENASIPTENAAAAAAPRAHTSGSSTST